MEVGFQQADAEQHFREEFSIMDELSTRAGFTIDSKIIEDGVIASYQCTRSEGFVIAAT